MNVNMDSIRASPYQPRLLYDLEDLKSEIMKDGLLNDLVVRKQKDHYELIDGERRWRVLKQLGWKKAPVRIVEADDTKARLIVYKLNKNRENYTLEEEAKYFKRLTKEGMTAWEISQQLKVNPRWVLAHLNTFKFPKDIQKAIWTKQISISHIIALENVIERNIKEAVLTTKEILQRKLTVSETKKISKKREKDLKTKIDEMRIKAVEKALPSIAPKLPKLKTPEEYEDAARILTKKAKEIRLEKNFKNPLLQKTKSLREKIETLEKTKATLLKEKIKLTEALSFNCPHCNRSCLMYQEGDGFWVE